MPQVASVLLLHSAVIPLVKWGGTFPLIVAARCVEILGMNKVEVYGLPPSKLMKYTIQSDLHIHLADNNDNRRRNNNITLQVSVVFKVNAEPKLHSRHWGFQNCCLFRTATRAVKTIFVESTPASDLISLLTNIQNLIYLSKKTNKQTSNYDTLWGSTVSLGPLFYSRKKEYLPCVCHVT